MNQAVTDLTRTLERSKVVSYGLPILNLYHRLYISTPGGGYNFKAYTNTLHSTTWNLLGLSIVLMPPIFFFILK